MSFSEQLSACGAHRPWEQLRTTDVYSAKELESFPRYSTFWNRSKVLRQSQSMIVPYSEQHKYVFLWYYFFLYSSAIYVSVVTLFGLYQMILQISATERTCITSSQRVK